MPITSPRASAPGRPDPPPIDWHDPKEHLRKIAEFIRAFWTGQTGQTGSVTLATGTTTTTVTDARIGADSTVLLVPTNADAAGEVAVYAAPGDGQFTINHGNDTRTRTFDYVVF